LPNSENEFQWSIKNFIICILGNLSSNLLQISIDEIMAAFRGQDKSDTLSAIT
jgi:hypothetical protein